MMTSNRADVGRSSSAWLLVGSALDGGLLTLVTAVAE